MYSILLVSKLRLLCKQVEIVDWSKSSSEILTKKLNDNGDISDFCHFSLFFRFIPIHFGAFFSFLSTCFHSLSYISLSVARMLDLRADNIVFLWQGNEITLRTYILGEFRSWNWNKWQLSKWRMRTVTKTSQIRHGCLVLTRLIGILRQTENFTTMDRREICTLS